MTEKLICNICIEPIEENSIDTSLVRLKCVPDKHYFCRKCIIDWYKEIIENSKKGNYVDYKHRMCPLCRNDGGYIDILKEEKFIKGIHKKKEVKKKVKTTENEKENKDLCKQILSNKKQCSRIASKKCDGYCGQHFIINNKKNLKPNESENIFPIIDNNINNNNITNYNNTNNYNNLSELEQFESGFNEVENIYKDYVKMWNEYDKEQKMNERLKLYEIIEMLKDQILALLNIISIMMDDYKNENNNDVMVKLIENQFKTLKIEEKVNILENEMIMFDINYTNDFLNEINNNNINIEENIEIIEDEEINNNLSNIFADFNINNDDLTMNEKENKVNNDFENLKITIFNVKVDKKIKNKNKKLK